MCSYIVLWLVFDSMPRFMEKVLIILAVVLVAAYALRMLLMFPHEAPMVFNSEAVLPRIISLFTS
jgi:Mn2+/Fe2+ NRAMP family transporter